MFKEKSDRPLAKFYREDGSDQGKVINDNRPVGEAHVSSTLRVAYFSYFGFHLMSVLLNWEGNFSIARFLSDKIPLQRFSNAHLTSVSICALILLLRNERIDQGLGKQMLYVFTIQSILWSTAGSWELIRLEANSCQSGVGLRKATSAVWILLNSFWACAGASTLVRVRKALAV